MRAEHIKSIGDEMIDAMRRIVAPLVERIAVLENARGEQVAVVAAAQTKADLTHAAALRLDDQVRSLLERVLQMPAGEKGERGDAGIQGERGIPGEPGQRGEKGDKGDKGDPGAVGERGTTGLQGPPGEAGPAGPQGERGEKGMDGRDGVNGERGPAGEKGMDGRDGKDGIDGKSITLEDVRPVIELAVKSAQVEIEQRAQHIIDRAVAKLPPPKDGLPGKDGRDAFDFADLFIEHDGERTFTVGFCRGDEVVSKTITMPALIDRGVYGIGKAYEKGDGVTYGGDFWIATRDCAVGESPGNSDAWRLAVRKGRDGKNRNGNGE